MLPTHYIRDTNTMYGLYCFCSLNCSKAYCLGHRNHRGVGLLNLFARQVYNIDKQQVPSFEAAGPVTQLKMFGGPLDIDTYRRGFLLADGNVLSNEKNVRKRRPDLVPPMFKDKTSLIHMEVMTYNGGDLIRRGNNNKKVLCRGTTHPRPTKRGATKNSLIHTMKVTVDNDDE